jgi:hypothetical protein
MRDLDDLFAALARSKFRSRFKLGDKELAYLRLKGHDTVLEHAAQFVRDRLAAAEPVSDGRQTPMRGHPVFIAQHATATCCRTCLHKWHRIAAHHPLAPAELEHVVRVIGRWLQSAAPERAG